MTRRKNEFNDVITLTDFVMIYHFFLPFIAIIVGLERMAFVPITQAQLITAVSIICTCLSMNGIVKLMKYVMGYIHKRYNTIKKERCWNQIIIGYAGITMCAEVIPKIIFSYVDDPSILYYCFITCLVSSVIFYYNFINVFQRKWRITYKKKQIPLILILLTIQSVVFIITIKIIIGRFDDTSSQGAFLVIFQILTSLFFVPIVIDIGVVLAGGIKKKQNVSALEKPIDGFTLRHQQDDDIISVTDISVVIHLIIVASWIIVSHVRMRASVPILQVHSFTRWAIFFTCLLMFGILKLAKYGMIYVHKRYNTEEMKRCRNQMIIGFGGVSMCGIIQRIVIYYIDDSNIIYYSFITTFITCAIFYYHFINEFRCKWSVNYKWNHISFTVLLWFIGLMVFGVTMLMVGVYPDRWTELYASSLVRFGIGLFYILMIFGPTMIDLVVVLVRGIKKIKKNVKLESVKTVKPSTPENPIEEVNNPKEPSNQLPKDLIINNVIDEKMQLGGI